MNLTQDLDCSQIIVQYISGFLVSKLEFSSLTIYSDFRIHILATFLRSNLSHVLTEDKSVFPLMDATKSFANDAELGGGMLLVESFLNEDKSGPVEAQLYSMNMLVQTEGRERTAAEYSKLLEAAGFGRIQVKRTGKLYDAVLRRK